MATICLIYPAEFVGVSKWLPLGIAYIGAVLEKDGHNVVVIDQNVMKAKGLDLHKSTEKILRDTRPDFVGITSTTLLIPSAFNVAKLVKNTLSEVTVVMGGPHPTALPTETLRECDYIDIVSCGEGEETLRRLAKEEEWIKIPGIFFRNGDQIVSTNDRYHQLDLTLLPFPARHLFDTNFYFQRSTQLVRRVELKAAHIFAARGCPYKCAFCGASTVFGKKVRYHPVEQVVSEVQHLLSTYNINGLYWAEDMFLSNKERATLLCEFFIKQGINKRIAWCAQIHPTAVDTNLSILMKRAGCIQVEIGFESGSQRVLNILKKGTSIAQNYRAAKITKKVGLRLLANVIVGIPGETREDFLKTINFIKEIQPDEIGFNKLVPVPGTQIFNTLKEKGRLPANWHLYHIEDKTVNFADMESHEFNRLYENFYSKYYLPNRVRNYLKYNLLNHPVALLKRTSSVFAANPGVVLRAFLTRNYSVLKNLADLT